jgi:hypothetical protein
MTATTGPAKNKAQSPSELPLPPLWNEVSIAKNDDKGRVSLWIICWVFA